jgi:hypothetical protein
MRPPLVLCAAASLVAGVSARAVAAEPANPLPECAAAPSERAPDPRCGETLDGRGVAPTSTARVVGRVVLFPPRVISAALFWPFVEGSDVVEAHHVADWLEAVLTSDDGRVGVRPLLSYATGFLPTAGLRFFYRRFPWEGSGVTARVQGANPAVIMGEITASGPAWSGLTLRVTGNRRNDRLFAGVGANSIDALQLMGRAPARFASDIWLAELRWWRPLPAHFGTVLHGDVQRRDYRADGVTGGLSVATVFRLSSPACDASTAPDDACVDPALLPGFQGGLRVVHAGAGVVWDLRPRTRDGSGTGLTLDATLGRGIGDDPSRHVLFSGESVIALGGADRMFILRGRAALVHALGAAPIPFEELASPSGATGMRGFSDGRFRGESGIVGTAEYRWYVSHTVDASLFSDLGTVAGPGFAGLGTARWFPDFGVGLRLYHTPATYWEGTVDSGVQLIYAPDAGFRLILAVATF